MSKGHRHAELMAEYARIATEHEKPWEFFEWLNSDGAWKGITSHPIWDLDTEYRTKPHTIRIGGVGVPEPMRNEPEFGSRYFIANPTDECLFASAVWIAGNDDRRHLLFGLCHATEEAAIAHAKALIRASGGKVALGQFGRL